MLSNQNTNTQIGYSPYVKLKMHAAEYCYGNWAECPSAMYGTWPASCDGSSLRSSCGKFGFYPWWDVKNDYYGLVGMYSRDALASKWGNELGNEIQPLIADILYTPPPSHSSSFPDEV